MLDATAAVNACTESVGGIGVFFNQANFKQACCAVACTLLLTDCAFDQSPAAPTYSHPPELQATLAPDATNIWCTSLNGAQFMAITGWFSPDCQQGVLPATDYVVTAVESYEFGTVKTLVLHVKASSSGDDVWIPLPEHEWA